jgi:hypothetical protein
MQDRRRFSFRVERDGVHVDVAAHPWAEKPVSRGQIPNHGLGFGPAVLEEVDDDLLVSDEVVIEAHRVALVCHEGDVREVTMLEHIALTSPGTGESPTSTCGGRIEPRYLRR